VSKGGKVRKLNVLPTKTNWNYIGISLRWGIGIVLGKFENVVD